MQGRQGGRVGAGGGEELGLGRTMQGDISYVDK